MKLANLLLLSPLVLFGLERVNLIRNASFEKEDSVWVSESGAWQYPNPAVGIIKDTFHVYDGDFSASSDTREVPEWEEFLAGDSVSIRQRFLYPKKMEDLDSLIWHQLVVPYTSSIYSNYCLIGFTFDNPESNGFGYGFINPQYSGVDHWLNISEKITDDTTWVHYERSILKDFGDFVNPDQTLSSFAVNNWGIWFDTHKWRGQKIYCDDIRLTGYADYDVGVKEILSGDSVWAGVYYKPVARIKSFGREAADDFLAIAEIRQGETLVWADTIPYTLPADTEDTLEFDSFPIPNSLDYTLTVRTEMSPDESDEDDAISKTLYGTGIVENQQSQAATLEVFSFTTNPRIAYSLPQGQSGEISIYDASGRKVESRKVQGSGEVGFSIPSSGVYFVWLNTSQNTLVRKAIVLK